MYRFVLIYFMLFSGLLIYPWKLYLIISQWKLSKYNFTLFNDETTFIDFPHVVPQFYFCLQFWQCQAVKRKAKLKLIHNVNVKSYKKKKTYFYPFKFQSPQFVSKFFCFIFTVWIIHMHTTCKTALDDIWACKSILRAITAVCFMKTWKAMKAISSNNK
jgi:hypothetical protein